MHTLLALALTLGVVAQPAHDPLLSRLAGRWAGDGTVMNQPAKITMDWSWELGDQFLKIAFVDEMGTAPRINRFEGHAYYKPLGNGRYRGQWFDNAGMIRPIEARAEGDALIANWGTPETEQGETTYRLLPGDRMEVVDRVKSKDGTWRDFGRTVLTRSAKQP